ncbi:hypothetical protein [Maribacter polysaccharolyticus]|uniref:hypothetical protein n=1 Tax=Maribacter polysaccharolyticus TaxID=3020831 RepID=UPI00237F260D|nr:hypothetical protein [Maribacter polysaccharolyticus]MDE3744059.1 hypothetical protein [Maribacter polysaccharolyticus]
MSQVKFKAAQATGSYTNKEGEKKNSYVDLGVVIEKDNGHLSLKLNALPLPNEKGEVWVNLFPFNKNEK